MSSAWWNVGRSLNISNHLLVRTLLIGGLLGGVVLSFYQIFILKVGFGNDFVVYYHATQAALAGEGVYGVGHGPSEWLYLYPPATLLTFILLAILPQRISYAVFILVTVGGGIGIGILCVREIQCHTSIGITDKLLICSFIPFSIISVGGVRNGNVFLLLAFSTALAFYTARRGYSFESGGAMAISALYKVSPAGFGLWYLSRRDYKSLMTAMLVGLSGLFIGIIIFGPSSSLDWLSHGVLAKAGSVNSGYEGGLSADATIISIKRPLSYVLSGADGFTLSMVAIVLSSPVLINIYVNVETTREELFSILSTIIVVLITISSDPVDLVFLLYPLIPLLYILPTGLSRKLVTAGFGMLLIKITPTHISTLLRTIGVESGYLTDVLRPFLAFTSPSLIGVLLMLAGGTIFVSKDRGNQKNLL